MFALYLSALFFIAAAAVGTNPLYVEREIEHQFNDAGVDVVVTLDFLWWGKLRGVLDRTPVKHVVVTSIPDYLPFPLNLLAPLKLKKTGQYVKVPREPRVHFFRELLQQSGLKVSHLLWAGGFTGSEGHTYRESVEDAAEALRTAAALGAGSVIVYSGARGGLTDSRKLVLALGLPWSNGSLISLSVLLCQLLLNLAKFLTQVFDFRIAPGWGRRCSSRFGSNIQGRHP